MGRSKQKSSKQSKTQKIGPGQHRKETKDERRARLIEEAKAKEDCLKILPYAIGCIIMFIIIFGMSVRSLSKVKLQIKNQSAAQKEYRDNLNHKEELIKERDMLQDKVDMLEERIKNNNEDEDIFDLDGDNL